MKPVSLFMAAILFLLVGAAAALWYPLLVIDSVAPGAVRAVQVIWVLSLVLTIGLIIAAIVRRLKQ